MSWLSFAVIGWQDSAFTSWNWSWGGKWGDDCSMLAPMLWPCAVEYATFGGNGSENWICCGSFPKEKPQISIRTGNCWIRNLEVSGLKENKGTLADQSQPSRRPLTMADWHIVSWSLCQQGLILNSGRCETFGENPAESEATCMKTSMHTNVPSTQLVQCLTSYLKHLYSPFNTIFFCLVDLLTCMTGAFCTLSLRS